MKVLFACVANVNRSQIAEAIFNKLSKGNFAISAGVKPRRAGVLVRNEHNNPVAVMKEAGYDLSRARVKKLTRRAVQSASKVVLIFDRKHMKDVPSYLRGHPDMELWEVWSISSGEPYERYCRLEKKRIAQIERRVRGLVRNLESGGEQLRGRRRNEPRRSKNL